MFASGGANGDRVGKNFLDGCRMGSGHLKDG